MNHFAIVTQTMARVGVIIDLRRFHPAMAPLLPQFLDSLMGQSLEPSGIVLIENSMRGFVPQLEALACKDILVVMPTEPNEADAISSAINSCTGDLILFCDFEGQALVLKRSALEYFALVADRHPQAALIYSDYLSLDGGYQRVTHLHDYHIGCVSERFDFGPVQLFRRSSLLEVNSLSHQFGRCAMYDLRLRLSERFTFTHISGEESGCLYVSIPNPETRPELRQSFAKDCDRLFETALTDHLRRIGAYLAPRQASKGIEYSKNELEGFKSCLASIVIPVNSRPDYISWAIESALEQTEKRIEIIVAVNGGCGDPTIRIVKEYMSGGTYHDPTKPLVRLVVHDINSIGFSLNSGIRIAKGRYYIQLDSDDQLKENAVEEIIAAFSSHPNAAMAIGSYEIRAHSSRFDCEPDISAVVQHNEWSDGNGPNNLLRMEGAGAPRCMEVGVLKHLNWFHMNDIRGLPNFCEDYDLVLRCSESYGIIRIHTPIYTVFCHGGRISARQDPETRFQKEVARNEVRRLAILRRRDPAVREHQHPRG